MNWPSARLKVVTMTEDDGTQTNWVLAGWQETYNAALGGRVFLTLQNGAQLREEVITSLEFNTWYPHWPTYEFFLYGVDPEPVEDIDAARTRLNLEGHRY